MQKRVSGELRVRGRRRWQLETKWLRRLLLDAALENIPYGFCVWSPQFTLVMWNQHYLDIYGFSRRRDPSRA